MSSHLTNPTDPSLSDSVRRSTGSRVQFSPSEPNATRPGEQSVNETAPISNPSTRSKSSRPKLEEVSKSSTNEGRLSSGLNFSSDRAESGFSRVEDEKNTLKGPNGKYVEIPRVLDGFLLLNRGLVDDPAEVYAVNLTGHEIEHVMHDDLTLFTNLNTLIAGENHIALKDLSRLEKLRHLELPCNDLQNVDIDVGSSFPELEVLDLSYNNLTPASVIALSNLPKLRKLDLTHNGLYDFPVEVANLNQWRDHVRQLWEEMEQERQKMPAEDQQPHNDPAGSNRHNETARSENTGSVQEPTSSHESREADKHTDAKKSLPRATSSTQRRDRTDTGLTAATTIDLSNILSVSNSVGFMTLETLSLERNYLSSPDVFTTLGKLPCLKSLNLNYNQFVTLEFLSPRTFITGTPLDMPSEEVSVRSSAADKYTGFYALEELQITDNLIETPEALLGVVWLPKIKRIWVQGNPVMHRNGQEVLIKRTGKAELIPFRPHTLLPLYGITLMDSPRSGKTIFKKLKVGKLPPLTKRGPLLRYQTQDNTYRHSGKTNQHGVRLKLTEDDVEEIIREGRILSFDELKEKQLKKEVEREMEREQVLATVQEKLARAAAEEAQRLVFDSSQRDGTFLTGVHIMEKEPTRKTVHINTEDREEDNGWRDDSEDEEEQLDYILPTNIVAATRALRQALANPMLYWKVSETQYAKETFASRIRKAEPLRVPLGYWLPSPETKHTGGFIHKIAEHERERSVSFSPSRSRANSRSRPQSVIVEEESVGKLNTRTNTAANKPKEDDVNKDLKEMMSMVDLKLRMVETNLSTVLSNNAFRKTIPNSTKLLQSVQKEYQRLEQMYLHPKRREDGKLEFGDPQEDQLLIKDIT